jgi:hypothetical protein
MKQTVKSQKMFKKNHIHRVAWHLSIEFSFIQNPKAGHFTQKNDPIPKCISTIHLRDDFLGGSKTQLHSQTDAKHHLSSKGTTHFAQ